MNFLFLVEFVDITRIDKVQECNMSLEIKFFLSQQGENYSNIELSET